MSAPLRFAHISDTHVKPNAIGSSQVFVDHLSEIRASRCDFVIHTGDLMDEPSAWAARAYQALISHLQVPIYSVPGNHDVYNPHMGGVDAPWWAKLEVGSETEAEYREWFGPSWYTFSHRGSHFVAVNSMIINSGLREETAQWAWLEETLTDIAASDPENLLLFTHMPLFIRHPDEELDPTDYRNRYMLIAPPGRDRLLQLIRRCRVTGVLCGHLHVPWETEHSWPEGFTTRFVAAGSSGITSPMAIEQFDLPFGPAQGLGYYEHQLDENGLTSHYYQHSSDAIVGRWRLGQTWEATCADDRHPAPQEGHRWYERRYSPWAPEWHESRPISRRPFGSSAGMAYYVRQMFEADGDDASLYLELLSEQSLEIYLNGTLLYVLEPLRQRPPTWRSAGGTYSIDSPRLCLGLNQGLVRRGENLIAIRVGGEGLLPTEEAYVAYRELGTVHQQEMGSGRGLKEMAA